MINLNSKAFFKQAQNVIPGGVNSPVRAFNAVGGTPIFIKKAKGAYLYDEDDNKYIDFISSWGPMIIGHAHPYILNSIKKQADFGTSYGIPTVLETKIAELAVKMVPNIDKIRFVNSGTEACMSAIRLARGYTKRDKVLKFSGCYHGHADSFLIQAGSGASTLGTPNSPGVTKASASNTILVDYNNKNQLIDAFKAQGQYLAAVILEPIAGNMGCVLPDEGFIELIRELCDKYGTLLIFDEVMTGFRLGIGGAQELLGIKADIITFGKVIGGGLPVGAFAGKDEVMNSLAPVGPVYQAGTLSGNPIAMSAGYAMLTYLNEHKEIYSSLEEKTEYLRKGFELVLNQTQIHFQINSVGSMISLHFTDEPVKDFKTAQKGDNEMFKKYFHGMLNEGIYLPPSAYESYFLNDAISYEDLDFTIKAFEKVIFKI
ncbi:MAG: glutamate-1-semialdehyde-2,1-aminomutase [Crocinitomicaceae bacterium]|nr:glutamate-1-semialdehyde-2,1-aminomutase [Crocinitomicaceae bacterium]|tara:strand:- start:875 stop:2161 length:1287 start_codon:yes stop_codon:yes gene_type:complete